MSDSEDRPNPLTAAMREDPLGRARSAIEELRQHWRFHEVEPRVVPLDSADPKFARGPKPSWITGSTAFDILKPQWMETDRTLARICQIISDQIDYDDSGPNYAFDVLPPDHELLDDFPTGSYHWFRALISLLKLPGADGIDGWTTYVQELEDWVRWHDHLRLRTRDVIENALEVFWPYYEYSLPEAKQNPIWSFPHAMAWIATRDYVALARLGVFCRSEREDEVVTDGVCMANTKALGWLQTSVAFKHCHCGALEAHKFEAPRHCTCLSMAWEELARFNGGLTEQTPELVFSSDERWISMTWPEGADKLRFLRRDILDRWPAPIDDQGIALTHEQSTASGELECRAWLEREFLADPDKRRSKRAFREAALTAFPGRLSERGFNLRVWPQLAREHGRDGAGAKKKS